MSFKELETGEQVDELSEGYNDYLDLFEKNYPMPTDEPLTFREWLKAQEYLEDEVHENDTD